MSPLGSSHEAVAFPAHCLACRACHPQVRLMTLRILSLFDPLPSSDGVPCSLLATCLQVEELPADLQHVSLGGGEVSEQLVWCGGAQ